MSPSRDPKKTDTTLTSAKVVDESALTRDRRRPRSLLAQVRPAKVISPGSHAAPVDVTTSPHHHRSAARWRPTVYPTQRGRFQVTRIDLAPVRSPPPAGRGPCRLQFRHTTAEPCGEKANHHEQQTHGCLFVLDQVCWFSTDPVFVGNFALNCLVSPVGCINPRRSPSFSSLQSHSCPVTETTTCKVRRQYNTISLIAS